MNTDTRKNETSTTLASLVVVLRDVLTESDIDAERVFKEAGIDVELLKDPLNRIPLKAMTKVWDRAVELTGDDCLGLQVGQRLTPSMFFVAGIAAISSENVLDAVKNLSAISALLSSGAEIKVLEENGLWSVELGAMPGYPEFPPAAVDAGTAGGLHLARQYVGINPRCDRVSFKHPPPRNPEKFEQWFRCPVEFNAARNALYFSKLEDLTKRFPTANSALSIVNSQIAVDLLKKLADNSISNRVRNELDFRLEEGMETDLGVISRTVGLSTSKLQNSLKSEGTSFQEILDSVRESKAIHLLTIEKQSVQEVAYQLGFQQISSFTRAFKKWTGKTPRQYLN